MANEIVERVARAISEVSGRDGHEVSEFGISDAAAILCARAAIAAMREPSLAMLGAVDEFSEPVGGVVERLEPDEVWEIMIEAAFKD